MTEPRMAIEDQFPVQDWTKIQLFSMNTPNGIKAGVALEELGLPYEPHRVDIMKGDQQTPAYKKELSPNGKIPVIVDPNGPDGQRIVIMESGAILLHLADKAGRLIPSDPRLRMECLQWLFFQVGHIGPMFGQFGHFHRFAKDKTMDTYALERYRGETKRLLGVLDERLSESSYVVADEYSIADIAIFPWVQTLIGFYDASEAIGFSEYPKVDAWLKTILERPAVQVGMKVTAY